MSPHIDVNEICGVPLHHRWVECSGLTLHVVTAGAGPPIVLLHGFPEHWWSWRHQIPALVRAGYAVWIPDLRGYNRSDRPTNTAAYALPHLVDDIAALARATGEARVHVAGHDWGGVIAWTFAGHYPELVDRLIILNAPHPELYLRTLWRSTQALRSVYAAFFLVPWIPEQIVGVGHFFILRRAMRRLAVRKEAFSEEDYARYVDATSQPGALRAALAYYRANVWRQPMTWGRRSRIQAPTLVVWGLDDPCLVPALLDGLAIVAPRSRVHRVMRCGHWVHAEAPGEVNRVMLEFLGGEE